MEEVPSTESLDEAAPTGLDKLIRITDPQWLAAQAEKPYRLGPDYISKPLHLVSGTRVGIDIAEQGPQRFARMLLVCRDHVDKKADLDFFAAALLVPEAAALGNNLDLIPQLGEEAQRKLARLHEMDDDQVASTVYELLVGLACVRKGRHLIMVPADPARKAPDYRAHDLGPFPVAIECKRRLGLTKYEIQEARHVEALFGSIRPALHDQGIHGSIEASFRIPALAVTPADFRNQLLSLISQARDVPPIDTPWGQVGFQRLPYSGEIPTTRLYSPDYLERVFRWGPMQEEWDGLLCEVEPPPAILVRTFKNPLCLKWRSESQEALTKKARGVTSLWVEAAKQIPAGEIGIVYIAYPEGGRTALADARTRRILEETQGWWHRTSIRIPMTIIGRLYARPMGVGMPDLIESALPAVVDEFWLTQFPVRVFTAGSGRSRRAQAEHD